MKTLQYLLMALLSALSFISCEQEFTRDNDPMLTFNQQDYPLLDGYLYLQQEIVDQKLILQYRNGLGRTVDVSMDKQFGITIEPFSIVLAQDSGTIEVPLRGTPLEAGINTLKVRIVYDDFTIFCMKNVGVRDGEVDVVEVTSEPVLSGSLLQTLPASSAKITFAYRNGWGRTAWIRFFCEEDPGLCSEPVAVELAPDGAATSISLALEGVCTIDGEVNISTHMTFEDEEELEHAFMLSPIEILKPIEYVEEEVKHELIVTDRNILMTNPQQIETREFTYKTVFVDMDGNGYVSGNHEIWLDRNVGATSTDVTSPDSYGFYYQGARNAPGFVVGSDKDPGSYYVGEKYKLNTMNWYNSMPTEVMVPLLDANAGITDEELLLLPRKVGPNNPCPEGYRPPTKGEFDRLLVYLGQSPASYTTSVLKLPLAGGFISNTATSETNVGVMGYYWGVAEKWVNFYSMNILKLSVVVGKRNRAHAVCLRCIKAKEEERETYE